VQEYWEGNPSHLVWVAPGAVRYDREHVDFLLPGLPDMREGVYSAEPGSGYTGGSRSGFKTHAFYEAACQVAAELDTRLSQTGLDRELVEKSYCQEWSDDAIARWYHMEAWEVRRRINAAVGFIASGQCQRWVECSGCVYFAGCRKPKKTRRKACSYSHWISHRSREWDKTPGRKSGILV
jgi:hypothetical protein